MIHQITSITSPGSRATGSLEVSVEGDRQFCLHAGLSVLQQALPFAARANNGSDTNKVIPIYIYIYI